MSDLLQVYKTKVRHPGGVGLVECQVSVDTAPYLVTSSKGLLWVDEPHPGGVVKAALRESTLDQLYVEMLEALRKADSHLEWGNTHPLTEDGLAQAVAYVAYYGLGPLELLVPINDPEVKTLCSPLGLATRPSSWVPARTVVVVPKDRTYVGSAWRVGPKQVAGILHNPARGIGMAYARDDVASGASEHQSSD